jgi:hypothetical protein
MLIWPIRSYKYQWYFIIQKLVILILRYLLAAKS